MSLHLIDLITTAMIHSFYLNPKYLMLLNLYVTGKEHAYLEAIFVHLIFGHLTKTEAYNAHKEFV